MVRIIESNNRQDEYNEYLDMHISGVKRSWNEILEPYLLTDSDLTVEELTRIGRVIDAHDQSKYSKKEYDAYLEYFYPSDGSDRDYDNVPEDVDKAFDVAWLHHQKSNPHHWQYWVLIRDQGKLEPMEMPLEYIFEMLCDWHSFSLREPESTAYKWWQDNKDRMILHDNTRKLIDEYVDIFKNNSLANG